MRYVLVIVAAFVACTGHAEHADRPGKVTVADTNLEVLDPSISFIGDTAEIAASSDKLLDAIAATLSGDPSIKLVDIVVHGPDKALSAQRAKAVMDQIVARKVAPERLRSSAGDEPTEYVAFVIVDRAKP
jgi:outer membrane protein OmpA-like peptidoglycan-associated protein